MMRKIGGVTAWAGVLIAALLSTGCGIADSGSSAAVCPPPPADCGAVDQNRYVYNLMKSLYFWADITPATDYTAYATPADVLSAMVYTPKDRWSFISPASAYSAIFSQGTYIGYGFGVKRGSDGVWRLYIVYPGSPAGAAGLRRGYAVTALNGMPVTQIAAHNLWLQQFGADEPGVQITMDYTDTAGVAGNITLTKSVVTVPPVYDARVLDYGGTAVGYLAFTMFNETTGAGVDEALARFQRAGIQTLVVDLRYNGGGLMNTAAYIAGRVADYRAAGGVFSRFRHNAAHARLNQSLRFSATGAETYGGRVIVITTANTASASEAFINGLKPVMEVALVGSKTHGKPAGMYGCYFCGNVIAAIAFEIENARGEGGYYGGIGVTCQADDTLTVPLGDAAEGSLNAALYYAANGKCPPATAQKPPAATPVAAPLTGLRREAGAF